MVMLTKEKEKKEKNLREWHRSDMDLVKKTVRLVTSFYYHMAQYVCSSYKKADKMRTHSYP